MPCGHLYKQTRTTGNMPGGCQCRHNPVPEFTSGLLNLLPSKEWLARDLLALTAKEKIQTPSSLSTHLEPSGLFEKHRDMHLPLNLSTHGSPGC